MIGRRGGYHHYHGGYYGGPGGGLYGLLAMIIIGIVAMPIVGVYLLIAGKDSGSKTLGIILLVVGIVIWIACGMQ